MVHNRVTNVRTEMAEYSTLMGLYRAQGEWHDTMDLLYAYYLNNGLYDAIRLALTGLGAQYDEMRPLRNPAYRVTEFYASKLWPGALPDALPIELGEGVRDNIADRVQDIWRWSNWASIKTLYARWLAIFGNGFLKVASDERGTTPMVILQVLDPRLVVEFDADDRDALQWIRIDTPQCGRTDDGKERSYVVTEVWDKERGTFRTWEHEKTWGTALQRLGRPDNEQEIVALTGDDYIPIVFTKHRDVGDEWGCGAYQLAIDKIDEANRQATTLHKRLFRHNLPTWVAMANAVDGSGRPVPAPRLADEDSSGNVELNGEKIYRMPGMSRLESLVPQIDYDAALAVLNAQMHELQSDLPELAYYELRDQDLSGVAIELLLGDAVDRLLEVRGNAEAGLIRAQQIALSVAQHMGLSGFGESEIGTYRGGDFAHQFQEREALPLTQTQRMGIVQQGTASGMALATAMRHAGYTDEQIGEAITDLSEERRRNLSDAQAYLAQERSISGEGVYPEGDEDANRGTQTPSPESE